MQNPAIHLTTTSGTENLSLIRKGSLENFQSMTWICCWPSINKSCLFWSLSMKLGAFKTRRNRDALKGHWQTELRGRQHQRRQCLTPSQRKFRQWQCSIRRTPECWSQMWSKLKESLPWSFHLPWNSKISLSQNFWTESSTFQKKWHAGSKKSWILTLSFF